MKNQIQRYSSIRLTTASVAIVIVEFFVFLKFSNANEAHHLYVWFVISVPFFLFAGFSIVSTAAYLMFEKYGAGFPTLGTTPSPKFSEMELWGKFIMKDFIDEP